MELVLRLGRHGHELAVRLEGGGHLSAEEERARSSAAACREDLNAQGCSPGPPEPLLGSCCGRRTALAICGSTLARRRARSAQAPSPAPTTPSRQNREALDGLSIDLTSSDAAVDTRTKTPGATPSWSLQGRSLHRNVPGPNRR